jgi:lipopolysaccharide/colanic/teichoic acid biosynthesis glycosyltransferase
MFKFRTMVEHRGGATSTSASDPRITYVGRILRRYKLDEVPQLLNVVLGDMSLVGPRPQVAWCVQTYSPAPRAVLDVRPGITDWASIEFRNEAEVLASSGLADPDEAYLKLIHPRKMDLQLAYVRERSFVMDVKILVATFRVLIWLSSEPTPRETTASQPSRIAA